MDEPAPAADGFDLADDCWPSPCPRPFQASAAQVGCPPRWHQREHVDPSRWMRRRAMSDELVAPPGRGMLGRVSAETTPSP